jgi:hypothetical protein
MLKTLTMLSFLALMFTFSANAQGCLYDSDCPTGGANPPNYRWSCQGSDPGGGLIPPTYGVCYGVPDTSGGNCPGDCGCPGNNQCICQDNPLPGCSQLVNAPAKLPAFRPANHRSSLIPDTMRSATPAQLLALNRSIAEFYLRKPVDVLVGP